MRVSILSPLTVLLVGACTLEYPDIDPADTDPVDTDPVDTDDTDCEEVAWFDDADQDGFGDADTEVMACEAEPGQVDRAGDCDDGSAAINPGAVEVCGDGVDNDCDGGAPACRPEGRVPLVDWAIRLQDDPAEEGESFGAAVALLPDVVGDGGADLLVGRPRDDRFRPGNGWVGLFEGGRDLEDASPVATWRTTGDAMNLGRAVAGTGDVDGDGTAMLFLAAPGTSVGRSEDVGAVYPIDLTGVPGDTTLSLADDRAWVGERRKSQAGRSLAVLGDVDGDGIVDLAIGAPEPTESRAGRVYLVPGDAASGGLEEVSHTEIEGRSVDQRVGELVAGVGDTDGDGRPELVVLGGSRSGVETRLWWFAAPGGTIDVDAADALLDGGDRVPLAEGVVAGAGDVDDDGYDDVIVGAPATVATEGTAGAAWLFRGPLPMDWSPDEADLIIEGDRERQYLGTTVAGVGDVDGDGVGELAIAALPTSEPDELHLVSGDLEGTVEARAVLVGPEDVSRLGQALVGGHDVDGDGLDDVVLGAPGFVFDAGEVWLLLGAGL